MPLMRLAAAERRPHCGTPPSTTIPIGLIITGGSASPAGHLPISDLHDGRRFYFLRIDLPDLYRRAASYIDLILKAPNPRTAGAAADKFELVVNLKTEGARPHDPGAVPQHATR